MVVPEFSFRYRAGKQSPDIPAIPLNAKDLYRIAKYLELTPEAVVEKYCETYIGSSSRLPIVRLKPRGSIKRCPLLKDRKCSVHTAKHTVCAMYPIGRCIRMDKSQPDSKDGRDFQIEYIFNDPGCGNQSESHTVREWLGGFGIPVDDESFLRWNNAISRIGTKLHEMEKVYPENAMSLIWSLVYSELYLHYDMAQPFDEQFQVNAAKLIDALENLPMPEGAQ